MNGLPHHHPMFGRGAVLPSAAQHPDYADPLLLRGRYAGMEPLLQQELMRRQAHHTLAAASSASTAPPIDDNARDSSALLARREEGLAWLNLNDTRDLLRGRYAGMEPLLLQQELMRRQAHHALAAASSASAARPIDNNASLLARREEERAWLKDEARDRNVEVDLARQNAASDARDRVAAACAARGRAAAVCAAQATQAAHAARAAQADQQTRQSQRSFRDDSIKRIVALQEQQVVRQREMESVRHAGLNGMDDPSSGALPTGSVRSTPHHQRQAAKLQPAAEERLSPYDSASRAALHGAGYPPHMLADEMSLRERMRRRVMEKEAIRNRHKQQVIRNHQERAAVNHEHLTGHQQPSQSQQQQDAASVPSSASQRPPSRDTELHRLLQLQHMSDEELVKYAAEVQSLKKSVDQKDQDFALQANSPAPQNQNSVFQDNLECGKGTVTEQQQLMEQQLMEARLSSRGHPGSDLRFEEASGAGQDLRTPGVGQNLRRGYGVTDRAHADMAVSREFSGGSEAGCQSQTSPTQHQPLTSPQDNSKLLRYFKNGTGVDSDGRPMPTEKGHALDPSPTNAGDAPSPSVDQLTSSDNNIIAKFLTVVVSRVPEIAPVVADLLPDGCNRVLLRREFPNIVDTTLAGLRSVQERLATASDAAGGDLRRRVVNCIAAIEPYKADLSNAGGMAALPPSPGVAPQDQSLARSVPPPGILPHPAAAAGMTRGMAALPPAACIPPSGDLPSAHPVLAAGMMRPQLPPGMPAAMSAEMMRHHPLVAGFSHPALVAGFPPSVPHHPAIATGMMWPLPPDVITEMMSHTPPVPMIDSGTGQSLMPNIHHLMAGANPDDLAMTQQAHWANTTLMQRAREAQAVFESNQSNPAETRQLTPLLKKDPTKPSSPDEDMPMMAVHKIKKEEAVKQKKKASKKKKKNRKPKVVHLALFRGALDMNGEERREVLRRERKGKGERALAECSKDELTENGDGGTGSKSTTGVNEGSANSVVTEE